jgi:hypothetical protein
MAFRLAAAPRTLGRCPVPTPPSTFVGHTATNAGLRDWRSTVTFGYPVFHTNPQSAAEVIGGVSFNEKDFICQLPLAASHLKPLLFGPLSDRKIIHASRNYFPDLDRLATL